MKKALHDRTLKALKPAPAGKLYDVMDRNGTPGFGVRVSDTGRKTFVLVARYPGSKNPTRRAIAVYDGNNLASARQKARDWLELIRQGKDPAIEVEREKAAEQRKRANSFRVVAEDFIAEKLGKERKGREIERDIKNNFLAAWSDRPITDISKEDIALIVKAKAKTAPAQARNLLGTAKRLFQWAIDQHAYGIELSPAAALKPTALCGDKTARDRRLSDDELVAFWRGAGRLPYPYGQVYRLLVLTGLRLNEVADAQWSEFDLAKGTWTIPAWRMKGKNGKARPHAVPLTPEIRAIIEKLPRFKTGDFLFSTTFGKRPVWMSDKIKEKLDTRMLRTLRALARQRGDDPAKVKLEHWQNHDLRRVVRSGLSRLRIGNEIAEAVLSHSRKGIEGVYDVYDYFDEKREALELWAARLRDVVSPPPANVVKMRA